MNYLMKHQSVELPKERLTFLDLKSGKRISFPMLKSTYQCIANYDALDELDMASIMRAVYEKVPRKSISIRIHIGEFSLEKKISEIAYNALFNCTQDEIDNLSKLPGLIEEIDLIVIDSITKHIRLSTAKQRKFAEEITRVLKIELNDETKNSKVKLSEFISKHMEYYELLKSEIDSNSYVCNRLVNAIEKYSMSDRDWKLVFNSAFNIYVQLSEYEQSIIVKDLIGEFSDKYWIDCQDCYLSQITQEIFTKLISSTDPSTDYAEQFNRLASLKEG